MWVIQAQKRKKNKREKKEKWDDKNSHVMIFGGMWENNYQQHTSVPVFFIELCHFVDPSRPIAKAWPLQTQYIVSLDY
jgi:hypothetical protein